MSEIERIASWTAAEITGGLTTGILFSGSSGQDDAVLGYGISTERIIMEIRSRSAAARPAR